MSDEPVSKFEFQQYKQITDGQLRALRAIVNRPLPIPKKGERGFPGRDAVIDQKMLQRSVQEVFAEVRLPRDGTDGKDGISVKGDPGPRGPQGPEGPKGDKPDHEWKGTELRFEKPDGDWGEFVNLKGPAGEGGQANGFGAGPLVLPVTYSYFPSGWN